MDKILKSIKTPAYVCEEAKVRKNLELLKYVKEQSGAKILVALKGFAFSGVMDLVGSYLDGATCTLLAKRMKMKPSDAIKKLWLKICPRDAKPAKFTAWIVAISWG